MNWRCASCGSPAKTNRRRCRRCGSMRWRAEPKRDLTELAGPVRRLAPKGLLLINPKKDVLTQDSGNIECGNCHMVIYVATGGFNAKAFQEAKKKHYLTSPACKE